VASATLQAVDPHTGFGAKQAIPAVVPALLSM